MASNGSIASNTIRSTVLDLRPGSNYDTRPIIPIPRMKRTRAKRGCDLCRKKKTRCDADIHKPCTNCANLNLECEFLVEQKKRGPSIRSETKKSTYVELLESRLRRMEDLVESMTNEKAAAQTTEPVTATFTGQEAMDYTFPTNDEDLTPPIATNNKVKAGGSNDNRTIAPRKIAPQSASSHHSMTTNGSHTPATSSVKARSNTTEPGSVDGVSTASTRYTNSSSNIKCSLICDDIANTTSELASKLEKITLADYERTKYIGMSAGVHLLRQGIFSSNKRHPIKERSSWFVQKVNDDEEEHILIKSEALKIPSQQHKYVDRTSVFTTHIPFIRQDRVDKLIQAYFTTYHPVCPVINKMSFLEQYYYQDPSPCDEYLLCAVCAIGARALSMLDRATLPACIGELSADELVDMECAFRDKTFSILDLFYKRSQISSVQTLILFTLFAETPENDSDDTSFWFKTGMAIRMVNSKKRKSNGMAGINTNAVVIFKKAQDLGLHRSASGWNIPVPEMELQLGRPVTIVDHELNVELPSLYEVESCHQKDFSERPFVPDIIMQTDLDIRKKTPLYSQFRHSILLGQIFGQVLTGLYSPMSIRSGRRNHALVHALDEQLKQWKSNLPPELLYGSTKHSSPNSGIVSLEYNCVMLLLYRPFITNQESEDVNMAFKALNACTVAANNILSAAESLDSTTLACIPWTISGYTLFQAAIIFLHNAKGNNARIAEQGAKNLLRCTQVIRKDPGLSATRMAIVLESIATSYSVNLNSGMCLTDKPSGPMQPPVDSSTLMRNENDPPCTDILQHHCSTQPDDMFAPSLSRGFHRTLSTLSGPGDSLDSNVSVNYQQQQPYPSYQPQQFTQRPTEPQLPLDSLPLFTDTDQWVDQKQQDAHMDALIWDLMAAPIDTPTSDPSSSAQQQAWPPEHQSQTQAQPLPQPSVPLQSDHTFFDLNCLSSEVPLTNMPNSVLWEDWNSFLKSNV
ncbi:hypothetical protein [Absidia glauca]|uniref:Zn(2)-C6 fungal-type domain-containing protein n=1 Tax=Absidia glauca TaxID=4829 RepID=A0A168P2X2_ABSGL|nr:hypothetical protein [Absidia glauca]